MAAPRVLAVLRSLRFERYDFACVKIFLRRWLNVGDEVRHLGWIEKVLASDGNRV